jgi:transposase
LEGRPSVPPEQLLLASLLQAFYGIRSERLLLEQLDYNLLFRWFVGLSPDDAIWHPTTFTKNRDRLLNDDVMGLFLEKLMGAPEVKPLLSDDHFSVDGTLLQAWASHASLKRIDGQEDPPGRVPLRGVKTEARMPWSEGEQGRVKGCHSGGADAPRSSTMNRDD